MVGSCGGPLAGVKILEIGGIGPAPFAGMMLAELGADVVRVDRPGGAGAFPGDPTDDVLNRGKRSIVIDLKHTLGSEAILTMIERCDVVIEGYRPGVAERLGIGPQDCWDRNPRLVYGRMTGWGQEGPLADRAGHDINYIAATGALHAIGAPDVPSVPLNLVGDFGGGALYLVVGVLAALREAESTGKGQAVDAAIVDGASHLLAGIHGLMNSGTWRDERSSNLLDGGAPFYSTYETLDGRHMVVGAIEEKFFSEFLSKMGLEDFTGSQYDTKRWPDLRAKIACVFRTKTQAEWESLFDGSDACVTPVLSLREAASYPHVRDRGTVREEDGYIQPAPAPRFSGHANRSTVPPRPPRLGRHTSEVLEDWGVPNGQDLLHGGVAFQDQ